MTGRVKSALRTFRLRYCRGVFDSFEAARAAIPRDRLVGYDNEASSKLYFDSHSSVKPTDYAAFYWLAPLLAKHSTLFDFGGHVGRLYYPFRKYLVFPTDFRWIVCDVPEVVRAGRTLAKERGASALEFTTEFRDAEQSEVLFSSGTLQYLEHDFASMLSRLNRRPAHLLINRVPLSNLPTWFTVQDYGPALSPYRIENRAAFIASLERLGYSLVDSWQCYESVCRVLLRPKYRVRSYTGMYLKLR